MRSQVQDRRALEGMYASVYICPVLYLVPYLT